MMELLLGVVSVLGGVALALVGRKVSARIERWWNGRKTGYDPCWCDARLTKKNGHRVASRQDDGDLDADDANGQPVFRVASGEGTAMVADFCKKHCPGGCQRGCPQREQPKLLRKDA